MKNKKIFLTSLILFSIILIIIIPSINLSACTDPVCGNGLLETGEECDDGNLINGDGCSAQCKIEENETETYCGNGILESGEECDRGLFNGFLCWAAYGTSCFYCNSNCQLKLITNYCGDGILNPACEECDLGELNGVPGSGCTIDCKLEDDGPVCEHDVAVRYSYSNSFGTGIAIKENCCDWISEIPAVLTKENEYKIKYYIDNKIEDTTNNINVIVKLDENLLYDYDTSINVFHYKELDLNISSLQCNNSYMIYLEIQKINETDCNMTDNYAQREIFIFCEESDDGDDDDDNGDNGDDDNGDDNGDNGDDDNGDDNGDNGDDDNGDDNGNGGGSGSTNAIPNLLECENWGACVNGIQTRICKEIYGYTYYSEIKETRNCISDFVPLAYTTDYAGYFEKAESAYSGPQILQTEPSYSNSSKNKFSFDSILSSGWSVFITFGLITLLALLLLISLLKK
ncbi:DUF4215 domain-containing protein [Candidatus Pacearchaeota archaeon]|nr:DUF4215 domain-containing protein [Candidatus Pacearchaeota archaeon]